MQNTIKIRFLCDCVVAWTLAVAAECAVTCIDSARLANRMSITCRLSGGTFCFRGRRLGETRECARDAVGPARSIELPIELP